MFFSIFGKINPPEVINQGYGPLITTKPGLAGFISNLIKLIALVGGLYAIINFILAGYGIMNSQGDPEKLSKAQSKIWNSVIGMLLIVSSFAFAAFLGWILFKDSSYILNLKIYGP